MKAGFGSASITPRGGKIVIAGGIPVRYTDEVHDEVKAVAMVLVQDGVRTIWVGCDICHPTKKLTDTVIESLRNHLPDFREEELILTATHATACFYLTDDEFLNAAFEVDLTQILPLEKTRRQVCEGITRAVLEAIANLEEITVEFAVSEILTGYCRRVVYQDGSAAMYGDVHREDFLRMEYPDGGGLQLLYFYERSKHELKGILAAVPCPSQADEANVYITADYWGVVRESIAAQLGGQVKVLGVCRAAGELSPRRMIQLDAGAAGLEVGPHVARRLGTHIADAIVKERGRPLRVYGEKVIPLARILQEIDFPVRKPTEEERQAAECYFRLPEEEQEKMAAEDWLLRPTVSHVRKVIREGDFYRSKVSAVKIGDLLIFTCPAELFTEYAKRIAVRFPQNPVIDVQLANDSLGYLPTKEAVAHGGYSTLIFSTVTTPEGGELLVREVSKMLHFLQNF